MPIQYKGLELNTELRLDVLVEEILCVELKAKEGLLPIHDAILFSYMQMWQRLKAFLFAGCCALIFIVLIFLKKGRKPL